MPTKGKAQNKKTKMKVKITYRKGDEVITYSNCTLLGKFPNISEGIRNKGFQALNEDNEQRRFCYDRLVAIEAE